MPRTADFHEQIADASLAEAVGVVDDTTALDAVVDLLNKYLKSWKGDPIFLDDIEHIQHMVQALWFTIQQMQKIDEVWKP